MKLRGVIRLPLYIAPYTTPATLVNAFAGGMPSFDLGSPRPFIKTAYNYLVGDTEPFYFEAINPFPFDYGHWKYNPNNLAAYPGAGANSMSITNDGLNLYGYTTTLGSFPTVQPRMTTLSGGVPTLGGRIGSVITGQPVGFQGSFTNGLLAPGGSPLAEGWYIQPQVAQPLLSNWGMCLNFNAHDPFGTDLLTMNGGVCYLMYARPSSISIAFVTTASQSVNYYPPAAPRYPYGGYLPTNIALPAPIPPQDVAPGNVLDPISITFDPPYSGFNDGFQLVNLVGCSKSFLIAPSAGVMFPGQNFTPILADPLGQWFYMVQFVPFSPEAEVALSDMSSGLPSVAFDELLGVFYLISKSATLRSNIFHTQSLTIPPFSINVDAPVPFVLPCFNPCKPFVFRG